MTMDVSAKNDDVDHSFSVWTTAVSSLPLLVLVPLSSARNRVLLPSTCSCHKHPCSHCEFETAVLNRHVTQVDHRHIAAKHTCNARASQVATGMTLFASVQDPTN